MGNFINSERKRNKSDDRMFDAQNPCSSVATQFRVAQPRGLIFAGERALQTGWTPGISPHWLRCAHGL